MRGGMTDPDPLPPGVLLRIRITHDPPIKPRSELTPDELAQLEEIERQIRAAWPGPAALE